MAAPKTVKTYPLNGTDRDFEIPFEYLARKFVRVTLIGVDRKELILNQDYRFTQRTIITLVKNWGPSDGYQMVELKRFTSATERLVDFNDGSILRAYDLNTSTVQSLHIAEEGRDIATDTIGVDNDGQLDARGRKIRNVANGTDPGDAVNFSQLTQYDTSTLNNANRARDSAAAALVSQQAALASQQAAALHANNAGNSANAAAGSQSQALDAMRDAQSARDAALIYRNDSQRWANSAENVEVTPGKFSSMHYSIKSANSAAQAFQDANRAKTEADRAKTEADKLGNANNLMASVETVNPTTFQVTWRGPHIWRSSDLHMYSQGTQARFIMRSNDGAKWGSLAYNSASEQIILGDNNGKVRQVWTTDGDTTVFRNLLTKGDLESRGGYVTVRAPTTSHWAQSVYAGPDGAEWAMVAGLSDKRLQLRAGGSTGRQWYLTQTGELQTSTADAGAISIFPNGNIKSAIYGTEGNLHGALYRLAHPRAYGPAELISSGPRPGTYIHDLLKDVNEFDAFLWEYTGTLSSMGDLKLFASWPPGTLFYTDSSPYYMQAKFLDTGASRKIIQFTAHASGAPAAVKIWGVKYNKVI